MEEVEFLCRRIYIMEKGNVVANGTKEELISMIDNKQRILLKVSDKADGVEAKIKQLNEVENIERDDNVMKIVIDNKQSKINDIINTVLSVDTQILSLDIEKPDLETVFLHLTGRALRD